MFALYFFISIFICCCSWQFPRIVRNKISFVQQKTKLPFQKLKHQKRSYVSFLPSQPIAASNIGAQIEESHLHQLLPSHPDLVEGKLPNGLTYKILPNSIPSGRFEAHMEVLSGSIKELDNQQGMAHLLEHVAYMGSPKRQLISGTGSRTNAYTDFHHTVFFAACPNTTPDNFWKKPMLPMAFDALVDVMTTTIDNSRLEKERAAVLSEASMVNKMDYRIECQILGTLHSENRLCKRFPIGKESQIKTWQREDLELYHQLHYRPENVILYVVGDVDVPTTIALINEKFGHLHAKIDADKVLAESKEFSNFNMQNISQHFPPLIHQWSVPQKHIEASGLPHVPMINAHLLNEVTSTIEEKNEIPCALQNIPTPETTHNANDNGNGGVIETSASSMINSTASSLTTEQQLIHDLLLPNTKVFQHDLLQSFSFHLFAKRPIEPLTTKAALKRDLMKLMILNALQIRLNIFQRTNPVFTLADFQQFNWIREGCSVCSLDITTDLNRHAEAIKMAIQEIKRLGLYGLTSSEFLRFKMSAFSVAQQDVSQAMTKNSEQVLTELMENTANGHTIMHPVQRYEIVEELLATMSLEEVNHVAKEICEHISHINPHENVLPRAIVTCIPGQSRTGEDCVINEQQILRMVMDAISIPVEPLQDTVVPSTLLTAEYMREQIQSTPPRWNKLADARSLSLPIDASEHIDPIDDATLAEEDDANTGTTQVASAASLPVSIPSGEVVAEQNEQLAIVQRQLDNGLRVNLISNPQEPKRMHLRLYIPGGRFLEAKSAPGSVLLGARTIQEGGAFLNMTREEVELFCIDHQVMVEISANTDHLTIDLASTTSSADELSGHGHEHPQQGGITGSEAVFQVAHILLTSFRFEEDAFQRAKLAQQEAFDCLIKGLETSCLQALAYSLTNGDHRYLAPNHQQVEALTMSEAVNTVLPALHPDSMEMTVSGDLSMDDLEALTLAYLGTVPRGIRTFTGTNSSLTNGITISQEAVLPPSPSTNASFDLSQPVTLRLLGKSRQLGIFLPDSEERAIGYLAGPSPNSWGITTTGDSLAAALAKLQSSTPSTTSVEADQARRSHPLFGFLALAIVQEVANRRLFSVVREERQLTYDASFQFEWNDLLVGGSWYFVTVTSSPQKIQAAVGACKEALHSLLGPFGVTGESVASSKRSLLQKWMTEKVTHKHWIDLLTGSQFPALYPMKRDIAAVTRDYQAVLTEITLQDIQLLVKLFGFSEEAMTVCVGIAAPDCPPGMTAPKQFTDKAAIDSRTTSGTALL